MTTVQEGATVRATVYSYLGVCSDHDSVLIRSNRIRFLLRLEDNHLPLITGVRCP